MSLSGKEAIMARMEAEEAARNGDPTKIEMLTDPRHQRFVGIAAHGNTPFDMPYITEVGHNLWQGGVSDGLRLPTDIVHVISLYPWEAYYVAPKQVRSSLAVWMHDSVDQDTGQVWNIANWVNACRTDGPTLVHCQAGLNRSAMVTAAALIENGDIEDGEAAINHLRSLRSPAVLCNPAFETYVREYVG